MNFHSHLLHRQSTFPQLVVAGQQQQAPLFAYGVQVHCSFEPQLLVLHELGDVYSACEVLGYDIS